MRRSVLTAAVLAAAMVVGCESMKKHEGEHAAKETTEATIAMSEVPAAVSAAFAKDYPGVTATEVVKETYKDGTVHYEFEYKDAAGKEHDVEYSATGEKLDKH
jgi:uncharacterized protein YcfL